MGGYQLAMRVDRVGDEDFWTAESLNDLSGWEIVYEEPWTEIVSRLHCRRPLSTASMEFRMIYCRTSILREVVNLETVQ
jgi:hypothetical protein